MRNFVLKPSKKILTFVIVKQILWLSWRVFSEDFRDPIELGPWFNALMTTGGPSLRWGTTGQEEEEAEDGEGVSRIAESQTEGELSNSILRGNSVVLTFTILLIETSPETGMPSSNRPLMTMVSFSTKTAWKGMNKYVQTWRNVCRLHKLRQDVQCSCSGWPTGNGKKLSNCQACCLAQLFLFAA